MKKLIPSIIVILTILVLNVTHGEATVYAVGDTVQLGRYEQDNDLSNGPEPVEWIVLKVDGTEAVLISKYALDCKPYNEGNSFTSWQSCTLRKWLNEDFVKAAFSVQEQALLGKTTVVEEANPRFLTGSGNETQDSVFLLSISEAKELFKSAKLRKCQATSYAQGKGAYIDETNGNSYWWLRTPGFTESIITGVDANGYIDDVGYFAYNTCNVVRPVIIVEGTKE